MDTKKDSASDVPTFKVARVGSDRKRKGAGFSFLRAGGSRGAWSGAAGGSGAAGAGGAGGLAGALGLNFSKLMLTIFLTASVGSAAVYLGARSASGAGSKPETKPKIFAKDDVKMEGDMSNLPGNTNTIPNSLGYLSGSRDGLTPEERAKKEADAAAAAEAQRLADEEAARKAEAEQTAGAGVDPNALLASAQADGQGGKGGAFGKKFGSLTSSFGGGSSLSGGAGLSGGVNRQFGSGGGMGAIKKGAAGQLSANKGAARPSYSKAGGARMASSKTKGFARKQLANANAYSRRGAAASKGESAVADAGSAFDNNPGAGNVISGPGVGSGGGSSSGADSTPNSVNNGGPTGGDPTVDCGADKYQDEYGNCKDIKTQSGQDANPTVTMLAKIAQGLLMAIAVLAALALVLEKATYTYAMGPVLRGIIGVMGGIVALMGVAIMAMGDYMQGAVFAGIGGFIGIACWAPGMDTMLTAPGAIISAGAGLLLSQAAGSLKSYDKNSAPVAAQQ